MEGPSTAVLLRCLRKTSKAQDQADEDASVLDL
jgi:hypothetical protein